MICLFYFSVVAKDIQCNLNFSLHIHSHKNSRRRRKIEQILKASGIRTPSSFDSDSWSEGSSSQDDQSETEGEDEPEQVAF